VSFGEVGKTVSFCSNYCTCGPRPAELHVIECLDYLDLSLQYHHDAGQNIWKQLDNIQRLDWAEKFINKPKVIMYFLWLPAKWTRKDFWTATRYKKEGTMKISHFPLYVVLFLRLLSSHIRTLRVQNLQGKWNLVCTELQSCAAVFFYNFWKEAPDSHLVKNVGYPLRFSIIFLCPYRPRPLSSNYAQFADHTNIRRWIILYIDRTQNETQIVSSLFLALTSC